MFALGLETSTCSPAAVQWALPGGCFVQSEQDEGNSIIASLLPRHSLQLALLRGGGRLPKKRVC